MGKSYKGNSEYGRKFRDQRKSKNKDRNKNNRQVQQYDVQDDMWMRSGQWENWIFLKKVVDRSIKSDRVVVL